MTPIWQRGRAPRSRCGNFRSFRSACWCRCGALAADCRSCRGLSRRPAGLAYRGPLHWCRARWGQRSTGLTDAPDRAPLGRTCARPPTPARPLIALCWAKALSGAGDRRSTLSGDVATLIAKTITPIRNCFTLNTITRHPGQLSVPKAGRPISL